MTLQQMKSLAVGQKVRVVLIEDPERYTIEQVVEVLEDRVVVALGCDGAPSAFPYANRGTSPLGYFQLELV